MTNISGRKTNLENRVNERTKELQQQTELLRTAHTTIFYLERARARNYLTAQSRKHYVDAVPPS